MAFPRFTPIPLGSGGGSPATYSYAIVQDQKAANTAGGTFTSGAWQTRTLNTIAFDPDSILTSLAANTITLPAGKYVVQGFAPAYRVGSHRSRLNFDSGTEYHWSESAYTSTAGQNTTLAIAYAIYSSASPITVLFEHYGQSTQATNGFGIQSNFGVIEIYSQIAVGRIG